MGHDSSGREPSLPGAFDGPRSSELEPMLGGEHMLRLYREQAVKLLDSANLSHLRRAAIGDWLAEHGDPRPGLGLRPDGLPDLIWCSVPGGEVLPRDGGPGQQVSRVYVSQYPVTWAQYRIFLEDPDGHASPEWWEGLRRREEYEREMPPIDNYPAQEVSWYDAAAYCRWLSARLGSEIRLPSEWEWQLAATDGDPERIYPWGPEWDDLRANTRESHLRRVTAVGLYPAGVALCGALDMCGTVLEWCSSLFDESQPQTPPPDLAESLPQGPLERYDLGTDGVIPVRLTAEGAAFLSRREARAQRSPFEGDAKRVVRGGSWFLIHRFAHTGFRTGYDPFHRYNSVGFRLACEQPPQG